MAFQFGTSGATPGQQALPPIPSTFGGTPAANALNNSQGAPSNASVIGGDILGAGINAVRAPLNLMSNVGAYLSNPSNQQYKPGTAFPYVPLTMPGQNTTGGGNAYSGLLNSSSPPSAPSSGIASMTHTDSLGNSVKTTYGGGSGGSSGGGSSGGGGSSNGSQPGVPQTPQTAGMGTPLTPQQIQAQNPNAAPGTIGSSAGAQTSPTSTNQPYIQGSTSLTGLTGMLANTAQGNIPIGQNAANIASTYGGQIAQVGQQAAMANAGNLTTGTTPVAQGNAGVIAQTAATQEQALASGEQAALQGTGQQLTAQNQAQQGTAAAGQLSTPGAEFTQIAPGTTALNSSGQPIYSGLGSLSQYQAELISNAQRGQYGTQAQGIATGLTALDNTYSNVQAIMKANGIDPTQYPDVNSMLQVLQAHATNPGGVAAFNEAMAQFKNTLAAQIQVFSGNGAITPTNAGNYLAQLNSSTLNAAQMGQLYNAVSASAQANFSAAAQAFQQSNSATQNATLPSSFSSLNPPSSYTPPANISSGASYYDPSNYNIP